MTKAKEEQKTDLVVGSAAQLPAEFLEQMSADAGMGVSTDPNEVGIPFLYILQDMSPQVKKRDPAYIEGAEVGDIYNNVTKDIYPAALGLEFIVVAFEPAQVEWKPNRGGFVAKHPADTPLVNEVKLTQVDDKMVPMLPNGNTLTETKYYYGFFRPGVPEDQENTNPWEAGVIGMASTMIACSREWQALQKRTLLPNGKVAPAFAKVYKLGTQVKEKADKSWMIWSIEQGRWVTGDEYNKAREFAEQALAGRVKVNNDADAAGAASEGGLSPEDEKVL